MILKVDTFPTNLFLTTSGTTSVDPDCSPGITTDGITSEDPPPLGGIMGVSIDLPSSSPDSAGVGITSGI